MIRSCWIGKLSLLMILLMPAVAAAQGLGNPAIPVTPIVQFAGTGFYQAYWNSGTISLTVDLTLAPGWTAANGPYTVNWATQPGTATAPTDYTAAAGTAVFGIDSNGNQVLTQTISITINNNGQTTSKTFSVGLSNAVNATVIGPSVAVVTISPPPPPQVVQFTAATYDVNQNVAGGSTSITVTLGAPAVAPVSVYFATSDGPSPHGAVAGRDYTATSGALDFGIGDQIKGFPVSVRNDKRPGPNRTVGLTLSAPSNGVTLGAQNTAVLTIFNDEIAGGEPLIRAVNPTKVGPRDRVARAKFVVDGRDASSTDTVTVKYKIGDNKIRTNAIPGVDFLPVEGTMRFLPGQTEAYVHVRILRPNTDPGPHSKLIEIVLYDAVNARTDKKSNGEIQILPGKALTKPTSVVINPVSSPVEVDPLGPINQVYNPAVIVEEETASVGNFAEVRATLNIGGDPDYLRWTVKNADLSSGTILENDEVRAKLVTYPGWDKPADVGDTVFLQGIKAGRIRLEARDKDDPTKLYDYYEAIVGKQREVLIRINLLTAPNGKGTTISPEIAKMHLRGANVLFRQAGILAVLDQEPKRIGVLPKLTYEPDNDDWAEMIKVNAKAGVVQVQYIRKWPIPREGERPRGGLAFSSAGTNLFPAKDPPYLTFRIDEKPLSLKYWIKAVAHDADALAMLRDDDMRMYPEYYRRGAPGVVGCALAQDAAPTKSDSWWPKALAHEIGHNLGLPHRAVKDDIGDNLKRPEGRNVMSYGNVDKCSDIDLIQARVLRRTKALKALSPP